MRGEGGLAAERAGRRERAGCRGRERGILVAVVVVEDWAGGGRGKGGVGFWRREEMLGRCRWVVPVALMGLVLVVVVVVVFVLVLVAAVLLSVAA